MKRLRGVWSTEDIALMEETVIGLTYCQAFLHLTIHEELPFKAVIEWLYVLAKKHPHSRLAVHIRMGEQHATLSRTDIRISGV